MYEISLLELPECLAALEAILEESRATVSQPVAIAIVNDYGELMAFARMDGATPAVQEFAVKKAYTAARMRQDLRDFRAGLEQRGRTVADYGDPNLLGMAAGGVVIAGAGSGEVVGAIGVSGGTPADDDRIARLGLQLIMKPE
jgi:glc operon protein GlcG